MDESFNSKEKKRRVNLTDVHEVVVFVTVFMCWLKKSLLSKMTPRVMQWGDG